MTIWYEHPQEKGMTYSSHMRVALSMAGRMAYGAVCLMIHSVFPFWFQTTGSTIVSELYEELHPHSVKAVKTVKAVKAIKDEAQSP